MIVHPDPEHDPLVSNLINLLREMPLAYPNEGLAIEALLTNFPHQASADAWRKAIADALHAGFVYDPVRLESGALHCQWRLELTSLGFTMIRIDQR